MRVLLSALACEPNKGSEAEVGFRALMAAASQHEVWALTASSSIPAIDREMNGDLRAPRVHLEGIGFDPQDRVSNRWPWSPTGHPIDRRRMRPSERCNSIGSRLRRRPPCDPGQLLDARRSQRVKKPLIWGPIGGGVGPPMRLLPELGPRGMLEAVAKMVGRPVAAMFPPMRETQRTATLILAQNPETGRRIRGARRMKLLSNAHAVELDPLASPGPRTTDLFVVGRLVPWKAPILALRALRYVDDRTAMLRFFGEGPEQARLQRAARKWSLEDRVRFEGWIPRPDLLPLLACAGALMHPAIQEEAGFCIAEALTLGTPVVALDHGGPSQLVGQWRETPSALVSSSGPESTARGWQPRSTASSRTHHRQRITSTEGRLLSNRNCWRHMSWSQGCVDGDRVRQRPTRLPRPGLIVYGCVGSPPLSRSSAEEAVRYSESAGMATIIFGDASVGPCSWPSP